MTTASPTPEISRTTLTSTPAATTPVSVSIGARYRRVTPAWISAWRAGLVSGNGACAPGVVTPLAPIPTTWPATVTSSSVVSLSRVTGLPGRVVATARLWTRPIRSTSPTVNDSTVDSAWARTSASALRTAPAADRVNPIRTASLTTPASAPAVAACSSAFVRRLSARPTALARRFRGVAGRDVEGILRQPGEPRRAESRHRPRGGDDEVTGEGVRGPGLAVAETVDVGLGTGCASVHELLDDKEPPQARTDPDAVRRGGGLVVTRRAAGRGGERARARRSPDTRGPGVGSRAVGPGRLRCLPSPLPGPEDEPASGIDRRLAPAEVERNGEATERLVAQPVEAFEELGSGRGLREPGRRPGEQLGRRPAHAGRRRRRRLVGLHGRLVLVERGGGGRYPREGERHQQRFEAAAGGLGRAVVDGGGMLQEDRVVALPVAGGGHPPDRVRVAGDVEELDAGVAGGEAFGREVGLGERDAAAVRRGEAGLLGKPLVEEPLVDVVADLRFLAGHGAEFGAPLTEAAAGEGHPPDEAAVVGTFREEHRAFEPDRRGHLAADDRHLLLFQVGAGRRRRQAGQIGHEGEHTVVLGQVLDRRLVPGRIAPVVHHDHLDRMPGHTTPVVDVPGEDLQRGGPRRLRVPGRAAVVPDAADHDRRAGRSGRRRSGGRAGRRCWSRTLSRCRLFSPGSRRRRATALGRRARRDAGRGGRAARRST